MKKCLKCGHDVPTRLISFSVEDEKLEMVQCKRCWMPIEARFRDRKEPFKPSAASDPEMLNFLGGLFKH